MSGAITLELYRHLFASVAEEMGVALMRSAFSANIKERRDYSCALFDARGQMIAQAAHIPVHLGSTPMSVAAALAAFPNLEPHQHVVLNDPYAGGTHLPDITVVSPAHDAAGAVIFYVANRAHHADVGGISPGSLPLSRHIDDEGFRVGPTLWSQALEDALAGASRMPDERRGDLRAQLAANRRGITRLQAQHARRGAALLEAAQAQLDHASRVLLAALQEMPRGQWRFEDALDDDGHGREGLRISCALTLDGERAVFDLRGCEDQVEGPLNVPRAVTVSAILYAVRCLLPEQTPANAGLMRHLTILTRPGSLLDACYPAPVAAGNVETSQRITDVALGALAQALPERIPAASGGSMSNLLVGAREGEAPFAYYETIGCGHGAGPGYGGVSATQAHMTNTLNTPVEALEHELPFLVTRYAVRAGSGGAGRWRGGDGIIREYTFTRPAIVTLMAERRLRAPYGLCGGEPGQRGEDVWLRGDETHKLAPKQTFEVSAGDVVRIGTPGGGGYGSPLDADPDTGG